MKQFIIHDADGNILRTGSCPEDMLAMQAGNGEYVIEGIADDATQMVSNNQLVSKSVDIVALKAELQDELRVTRNSMLTATDWTQIPDAPITSAEKAQWQIYRQSLRDLPNNYANETDLSNVIFPIPPYKATE